MKFTIVQSKTNISKSFELNKKGELEKKDGGNLHTGSFRIADMNISELEKFILSSTSKEIIIQGITDNDKGLITTKGRMVQYENATHSTVSRSKEYFFYKECEGFLLLDYDPNEFYNNGVPLSKEEFLEKIYSVVPEIKNSPHLWKTSSGSNIARTKKNGKPYFKEFSGIKGQHLLIHVSNMLDIPEFFEYLYKKLWISGEGYVFIDKVGRLHDRSIVDKVVNSPEREIFLRAELTDSDLEQDLMVDSFNCKNNPLDLRKILDSEIDMDDIDFDYNELHKKELSKFKKESKKILDSYVKKNAKEHSVSEESLRHSITERKLFSDFKIRLHDNTFVTIENILKNPDSYSGMYCYEPFEPEYGGYCNTKAWIDSYSERIYSHAHGGIEYTLEDFKKKSPDQLAHHLLGISNEKERYKEAGDLTNKYKYEATEIDSLLQKISDSTGQKNSSVAKTYKKYNKNQSSDNNDSFVRLNFDVDHVNYTKYDCPLDMQFPNTDIKGRVSSTASNLKFMLDEYGISYDYNKITKRANIHMDRGGKDKTNLSDEADFLNVQSMCVVNGMTKDTATYLPSLMDNHIVNPLFDWIRSEEWDGKDRIREFIDRIGYKFSIYDDINSNIIFSNKYMKKVVKMWLTECIASLDGTKNTPIKNSIPSFEYVLVFVGKQGIGKTKFLSSLVPFNFRDHIVTGHELDTKNKDSVKKAISCWICELGELDSTFKKSDISSLKAFLSDETDIIRLPYGKTELRMKRSTTFCGSVNDYEFLRDKTGNRRYLPISVENLSPLYERYKYEKQVILKDVDSNKFEVTSKKNTLEPMNMQQFWAQIWSGYLDGEEWWPDNELRKMLEIVTEEHSQISFMLNAIDDCIDLDKNDNWREIHGIKGNNSKYVEECSAEVKKNLDEMRVCRSKNKEWDGYDDGSLDEYGKSITIFSFLNIKEIFSLIEMEYNRQNMREFSEILKSYGIGYSQKRVDGKQKKCYSIAMRKKGLVLSIESGKSKG